MPLPKTEARSSWGILPVGVKCKWDDGRDAWDDVDDGLILPVTEDFMHGPARSAGGDFGGVGRRRRRRPRGGSQKLFPFIFLYFSMERHGF